MVYIDIPIDDVRPDTIRAALAGRDPKIPPSAALAVFADLDLPAPERVALLRDVTHDNDVEPMYRIAALSTLRRLSPDTAVPELLDALEAPDDRLAAAAATGLGLLGTPEQLPALQLAHDKAADEFLQRRVAFAQLLIVHRFGVTDTEVALPRVDTEPFSAAVGGQSFTTTRPGPRRRAQALAGIRREVPSLDPATQDVYELQCGPRLMAVAAARDITRQGGSDALRQRPALAAVVAFHDVEHDGFYPGLLAFTRPAANDRVTLLVTRFSGEPAYVGEGTVERGQAVFELTAAAAPGIVPITARIRLTGDGLEINGVSDRTGRSAVHPMPAKNLATE